MQTTPETNLARGRCWQRRILYPLIALCVSGSASLAGATDALHEKTTYTVIQLGSSSSGGSINDKGQVAFNEESVRGVVRAKFYDGKHVHDIGTLGGPSTTALAVNNLGQVTGTSTLNADGSIMHAFRWSLATGIFDLNRKGVGNSVGVDINNKGQVTGPAAFPGTTSGNTFRGFFWTPQTGMLDIGSFGPNLGSMPVAMNDAGVITGDAETGTGGPLSLVAFRWSKAEGFQGIGTLPGEFTRGNDINNAGHIVGESPFPGTGSFDAHAFLWTRQAGLIDLGTGSNTGSVAFAINDHDVVVGQTLTRFVGPFYGFVWTRATGLIEFKPQTPFGSSANDVNNHGLVVGNFGQRVGNDIESRALVWTRAEGVVDLNTRIVGAPAGLTLFSADAISDNGSILASSNTGLVLLVPRSRCTCTRTAPTVGAVTLNGTARAGAQLSFAAAFNDIDLADTHKANWAWGDGSKEVGTVIEKNGAGNVSGQHVYAAPGIYTAALTVTDSSGQSTTVKRKLTVSGAGSYIAGQGWFMSPRGASSMAIKQGGIATFAVLSGANNGMTSPQGKAHFEFSAAGINFRSEQIDSQSVQGSQVQYSGKGRVNGAGVYNFTLTATATAGKNRVRIRIWHYEPGSKAEVIDYDNQRDSIAMRTDGQGSVVEEGGISIQQSE
jgi:probable HAF family extracellular repeat protein